MFRISFLLTGLLLALSINLQAGTEKSLAAQDPDTADSIIFTNNSASEYILGLLENDSLWRNKESSLKQSLKRLLDHYQEPFDSVKTRLNNFEYDSVSIRQIEMVRKDTLPVTWLNDSTFIFDTPDLKRSPFILEKKITRRITDVSIPETDNKAPVPLKDTIPVSQDTSQIQFDILDYINDSTIIVSTLPIPQPDPELSVRRDTITDTDTITTIRIDSAFLSAMNIELYKMDNGRIIPPILPYGSPKSLNFLPDSGKIIISDTFMPMVAGEQSPFFIVPGPMMPDSLHRAVETLMSYTYQRDSILVYFNDVYGHRTPFWLTAGSDELYRYWVKNYKNDSITLWMGNPSKHDITLILEEAVNVNRMAKERVTEIPIIREKPDISLAKVEPLEEIPVYWEYDFSTAFTLNQTYLSNWSKGGENSFSSVLDIQGAAKYTDTEANIEWTNSGRLKYGNIITEQNGLRTTADMLELNSKYNKILRKKVDFSALFYMKNQIAKGYNYPNDSVVVSKFLNPGTFTIGAGVEYEPFKKTLINFSPLSYKNTFVLDTAGIDQTIHGIDEDKKAKQEMGGQLLIKNSVDIFDDLNLSNSVRLFSNYLNKPQNIDVDWEINLEKKISWYFTVLLNLHMIYDDDIRFPLLDDNDQPVKLPDGSTKKVPKLQLKQFLGLTFSFKF